LVFSFTSEERAVYTWGYGVLGCGPDVQSSKTPMRIETFDKLDEEIIQVHCGTDHAAVLTGKMMMMMIVMMMMMIMMVVVVVMMMMMMVVVVMMVMMMMMVIIMTTMIKV